MAILAMTAHGRDAPATAGRMPALHFFGIRVQRTGRSIRGTAILAVTAHGRDARATAGRTPVPGVSTFSRWQTDKARRGVLPPAGWMDRSARRLCKAVPPQYQLASDAARTLVVRPLRPSALFPGAP